MWIELNDMLGRKENNRIVHSQSEQADAVFLKNQPSWGHLHKSNPLLLGLLLSTIWSLISLMQRCCSVSLALSASALVWSSIFAENGVYKPRQVGIICRIRTPFASTLEAKNNSFVNPFGLEARPRVHTYFATFFPYETILSVQFFLSIWCKSQPFFLFDFVQVEPPVMRMWGTILGHADVRDSRECFPLSVYRNA